MKKFVALMAFCLALFIVPARARTLVVGISENLSADARDAVNTTLSGVYIGVQPGDNVLFIDANRPAVIESFAVPAAGYASLKEKARALGSVFQGVYEFTGHENQSVPAGELNLPELLPFIGRNIVPGAGRRLPGAYPQVQVLLLGSIVFDNPHDAGFTFREAYPSDGMLYQLSTVFNISGRETLLGGALVSICYTDRDGIRAMKSTVQTNAIVRFWGKTITGQGGQVGSIVPISPACADRLFSTVQSSESFEINRNDKPELIRNTWITVDERDQP